MPLPSAYILEIDFDRNGTYTNVIEDGGLGTGAQLAVNFPEGASSTLNVTLENRDGDYSPRNSAGAYFPYAGEEGLPIRLRITHNAVTYTVFTGYIEDWDYTIERTGRERVAIRCGDILSLVADDLVSVDAAENYRVDQAFGATFQALGIDSALYDVSDISPQSLPTFSATRQPAREVWRGLLSAEMGGYLYVAPSTGKATFKARDNFLGVSGATSYGDGTSIKPHQGRESRKRGGLFTKVEINGQTKDLVGGVNDLTLVYDAGYAFQPRRTLELAAGQRVGPFRLVPNQEGVSAIYGTPVCLPSVDYLSSANDTGTPLDTDVVVVLTQVTGSTFQYDVTIENTAAATRHLGKLTIRARAFTSGDGNGVGIQRKSAPGSNGNDAGIGTIAWSDPTLAGASDNIYTTNALTAGATSNYLVQKQWGFAIPSNATILGILVEAEAKTTDTATVLSGRIVKAGVILTTVTKTADLTTTEAFKPMGGAGELFGTTWTPAEINDSGFGVAWYATDPTACTVSIDSGRITVFWIEQTGLDPDKKGKGSRGPINGRIVKG